MRLQLLRRLQTIWLVVWTALCISFAALLTLVTFSRDIGLTVARKIWAPGMLKFSGARLTVERTADIDWSKPHIYAMNHQSQMDIPCGFAAVPIELRFVAKHTLAYVPFLGFFIWMTGMIFINRTDRRKSMQSLKVAGQRIRQGRSIIAFPEGTRSRDGRILPFKKGPFLLALEAGVPIVPMAIEGTRHVLPPGRMMFHSAPVRLKIGTPIRTDRAIESREALLKEVRDAIVRLHQEIGGLGGHAQAVALPGQEGTATPAAGERAP